MIEMVELPAPAQPFAVPPGASIADALRLFSGIEEEPVAIEPVADHSPEEYLDVEMEDLPPAPSGPPQPGPVLVSLLAAELGVPTDVLLDRLRGLLR